MREQPRVIRIRDIARHGVHELGPNVAVLRGPYNLFNPVGPARVHGNMVDWLHGTTLDTARVVPGRLGDVHPGERVLVQIPPLDSPDEWWLCDVEAVNGVAAS
jgi:hypothetical protein